MPEGTTRTPSLYERDYYAWALDQAAKLRDLAAKGGDSGLDLENLAGEVDDLASSERDAVRSQIRRIVEHLLKLQYSPSDRPRAGWRRSIAEARVALGDKLTSTLTRHVIENWTDLYGGAKHVAEASLAEHSETPPAGGFPETCPYTLEQVLDRNWLPPEPASIHSPKRRRRR